MTIWQEKIKNIKTNIKSEVETGEYAGIKYEKWFEGDTPVYRWLIERPFSHQGKLVMSLREKILDKMVCELVKYFYLSKSNKRHDVPTPQMKHDMEKNKMFEKKESKFVNGEPFKMYYFEV